MTVQELRQAENERYRAKVVAAMQVLMSAGMSKDKQDGFLIGVRFMVALRKEELAEQDSPRTEPGHSDERRAS